VPHRSCFPVKTLVLALLISIHWPAQAERLPPWSAAATEAKAEYEPVFKHYRMMDRATPEASEGGSHKGYAGHEGHDMATPHRGHRPDSPPAARKPADGEPDAESAPTNHDAEHQHHH
jgi:hypothetical protein